jgi:TP901 family phage tail tape measure protein
MADVNANIGVNIDTSLALAQLKSLQRQISQFHTSISRSSETAALAQKSLQKNFLNSVNAIGSFSAELRTVKSTTESFTASLEGNKFSMREYFRYAGGSTKTFGKLFKSEFDTIGKVAEDRVKKMQTQYIKMGRDINGAMQAISITPTSLDMQNYGTKTAIAAQKQALFNQLMKQGSTNLLNFGKNTQWAGRQLMVGFTIPLAMVGSAATKTFMQMETQAIKFKKVYGDLFTPQSETQQALDNITELGKAFTKYGVAVSTTVGLAAEAAAAGFSGLDLQRQTTEATRLSILGQLDSQKALETTISLQNAFAMSSENLAESIDFLNAVENQTVVSLDDITTAIPKVAPVIQQLGGDVKDLTFFMAAMKEGGINASEGANALKSGLASLINPTGAAAAMLGKFGINANEIVTKNKGDLKATVIEFAEALNELDPLNRAQAIEQMFGKFQFARLSTLFANVAKDGNQAARVLSLANSSVEDLAALSEQELGMTAESSMNKFKKAVEDLKFALVPVGQAFLEAVTPIVEFVAGILEKFGNLSDGTKKAITIMTVAIGAIGPIALMTFGLLANGVANIIKLFLTLRNGYLRLTGQSQILGEQTNYLTTEQMEAAAASHSLNQAHATLTQQFTAESAAVQQLIAAYQQATAAGAKFAAINPGMMRASIAPTKRAKGKPITVGGTGNKDTELALLMPGETVIPTEMSKKYGSLINAMIADNIPGYMAGKTAASHIEGLTPAQLINTLSDPTMKQVLSVLPDVGVSLRTLSTTADGMVKIGDVIETSLKDLSTTLSKNNIKNALAVGTPQFSGTTIQTDAERNQMLHNAGIAGEPVTFEDMKAASTKAQAFLDTPLGPSSKKITPEKEQQRQETSRLRKLEAQKLIQEQVDLEQSLVGLSTQESELKKADFTKTKTTQALEDSLRSKGLSAQEAATLARQEIADSEKSVAKLVESAKTDLEKRKIKEASYKATLLKEMGQVTGYDEKNTKETLFSRTKLNAVTRDMARGSVQYATPYKAGEEVPQSAAKFGSGTFFKGLKGGPINRDQSALIDPGINLQGRTRYQEEQRAFKAKQQSDAKSRGKLDAKKYQDGVKSANIQDPYVSSRDRKSPHPLAAKDGKDDATAYENAREKTTKDRSRRMSQRPQGPPTPDAPVERRRRFSYRPEGDAQGISQRAKREQEALAKATKEAAKATADNAIVTARSRGGLAGFDRNLMGASFAISSLSGLASMSGGKLGEMSGIISKLTGGLFALQAVTSLLTQTNATKLAMDRLGLAQGAIMSAKMAGEAGQIAGRIGKTGLLGNLARVGLGLKVFLGPIGLATTAAGLLYAGFRKYQSTQEKARLAIEGLGDAAVLSTGKVKTLEDFFGVKATKSPLQRTGPQLVLDKQKRSQVDELRANEDFQKNFGKDIEALRNASNKEVGLIFKSIAMQLSSQGFSKANIDIIVKSLQEEAGKTNVTFDFDSIDLKTEKGRKGIAKTAKNLGKVLSAEIRKAQNKEDAKAARTGVSFNDKSINALANRSEELKKSINTISKVYAGFFESLATGFKSGQINAQEFNSSFQEISTSIKGMPPADGMALLNAILKTMPNDLAKSALGLKDNADKMLILQAAALGVATITPEMVKALGKAKAPGATAEDKRNAARIGDNVRSQISSFTDLQELVNKTVTGTTNGYKDLNSATEEMNPLMAKRIDALNKEIDVLEKKKQAQQDSNDETQRQIDLEMKLADLASEATQAKISGDFIKASMLKQEAANVEDQFNRETEIRKEDAKIEALKAQVARLEEQARKKSEKPVKKKAAGGYIAGKGTGTSDSIPALLSNGEYVIKASAVGKYGKDFLDDLNAKKFAKGGMAGAPHQLGMGSGSGKKLNTFQKLMMTMAKDSGPLSSFLGLGSLYKSLAGQGGTGDKLSSAMIPLGSMSRVAKGAGSVFGKAIPKDKLDELTKNWPPNKRSYKPGFQYTLGNQDPLHGPLQVGMFSDLARYGGYNPKKYDARRINYTDPQFGRIGSADAFLTGTMKERGMYATAQYMEGNKGVMAQMQELGNHPLGPIAAMKTLQKKFTGKLFRGIKLDRTFKGLPQELIDSIKLARETGDASSLVGKEFIMRRSSWSKDEGIASFFAPGRLATSDSVLISANVKNRNILPSSELFPDKKFMAPYGQSWGSGKFGADYKSEKEAIFGGKFRVIGFKDGKLDVESISGVGKYAKGGLIVGPGSGTSDSISASLGLAGGGAIRVSNGEYVVKAAAVEKYGVGAMNAINNGTATLGTSSGGTVYNINMPITSNAADAQAVATEVMSKLKLELNKSNKTNMVKY